MWYYSLTRELVCCQDVKRFR